MLGLLPKSIDFILTLNPLLTDFHCIWAWFCLGAPINPSIDGGRCGCQVPSQRQCLLCLVSRTPGARVTITQDMGGWVSTLTSWERGVTKRSPSPDTWQGHRSVKSENKPSYVSSSFKEPWELYKVLKQCLKFSMTGLVNSPPPTANHTGNF